MAMNFMGLGFSFGAKDNGLTNTLSQVSGQLSTIVTQMDTLISVQAAAGGVMTSIAEGLDTEKLGDVTEGVGQASDAFRKDLPMAAKKGAVGFSRGASSLLSKGFAVRAAFGWIGIAAGALTGVLGGLGGAFVGAGKMAGKFLNEFSVSSFQKSLDGLNSGLNLTTALEGTMQQHSEEARKMGANMGYTGKQLNKFSQEAASMAYNLNIGSNETAMAIRAFDEAGDELSAMGLKSASAVAKFTSAYGINADLLRNSSMQMTREFGFTNEQASKTMSSIVAMGQATGDVSGAMEGLPEIMQQTRQRAAMMGNELNPEELADMATQSQALAAGLFQLDQDSGRARESAMTLSNALVEAMNDTSKMFAGTESDLNSFVENMAISTGDVDKAFSLMKSGPAGFVQGMTQMVAEAKKNGKLTSDQLNFIRNRMASALGDDAAAQLTNFFTRADQSVLKTMGNVQNATKDLGKLGKEAFRTGLTLEDRFTRALDGAEHSFRKIARSDTRKFVQDVSKGMKKLSGNLKAAAKHGGPLGDMLHQMSLADQLGGLAFLPEGMRAAGVQAKFMADQLGETMQAFTSLGGLADMGRQQFALFATTTANKVGEMWKKVKNAPKEGSDEYLKMQADFLSRAQDQTAQEFGDMYVGMIDKAEKFLVDITDAFAKFDWETLFSGTEELEKGEQLTGVMGMFQRVFERLKDMDWGRIWGSLEKGLEKLWAFVGPWFSTQWKNLKTIVGSSVEEWGSSLWTGTKNLLYDWGKRFLEWYINEWPPTAIKIAGLIIVGIVAGLAIGAYALINFVGKLLGTLAGMLYVYGGKAIDWLAEKWSQLTDFLGQVWDGFVYLMPETWEAIKYVFFEGMVWVQGLVAQGVGRIKSLWSGVGEVLGGMWDTVKSKLFTVWTSVEEKWNSIVEWFRGIPGRVMAAVSFEGFADKFKGPVDKIKGFLNDILGTAEENHGNSVNTIVGEDMAKTAEVVKMHTDAIAAHFQTVLFGATVKALTEGFAMAFEKIQESALVFGETLVDKFQEIAKTVSDIMVGMYEAVSLGALASAVVIEENLGEAIQKLKLMAEAQEQLAEARWESERAAPEVDRSRAQALSRMSEDLQAIHDPMWYSASGGYKDLFVAKMNQLIAAQQTVQVAGEGRMTAQELKALFEAMRKGNAPTKRASRTDFSNQPSRRFNGTST